MAEKDFLLPDLGEGLTEGEVVRWLVEVGDTVSQDQPVAEVETAKAVVEVPSPFVGTVTALHAEVGDEVAVGTPLVTFDLGEAGGAAAGGGRGSESGDSAGDGRESESGEAPGTAPQEAEQAEMVPEPSEGEAESGSDGGGDGESGSVLVGYGTGQSSRARRRRAAAPAGNGAASGHGNGQQAGPAGSATGAADVPMSEGKPLAKPPVRKLAKDLGVDLAAVPPSSPEGIITREDVQAFAGGAQATQAPAAGGDRTERIPLRGVRKAIAERMATSRREIPEATTSVDCDATPLMELREELNASQSDVRVSALAIILRACVAGLGQFPDVNARLDTEREEIVRQHFVHLGVAAQTDRGLLVPVIADADRRSTLGIAAELNRLAAAARDGSVGPSELTGGTFTVSNYGSFGVDGGNPVINHPEAAILGVGRIVDKPWVVDGALAVRSVATLTIAFDHRICDGGEAAGFLRFVADCVERPARLLAAV